MQCRVPAEYHGIEGDTVGTLISEGLEDGNEIERVLETAAPPPTAVFARNFPSGGCTDREDLRFRKRVGKFLAGFRGGPHAEVETSFLSGRWQILSERRGGHEQNKQSKFSNGHAECGRTQFSAG